jgi:hypothetical protein
MDGHGECTDHDDMSTRVPHASLCNLKIHGLRQEKCNAWFFHNKNLSGESDLDGGF